MGKNIKNILIIHPEGNFNNNPSLYSLMESLSRNGYIVTVLCNKQNIDQTTTFRNISVRKTNKYWAMLKYKLISIIPLGILYCAFFIFSAIFVSKKYDLIIGIDREGIIEASILSKLYKCEYGLWSFEIMFEDETPVFFKKPERIACQNVKFAIVQDRIRSGLLSKENNISIEKIFNIPVAGRKAELLGKNYFLHDSLNIDRGKKILLFIGTIDEWTMIDDIIEHISYFPDEWVLVLHDRYGQYGHHPSWFVNQVMPYLNKKVFISGFPMLDFEDLKMLVSSADMGIGLYKATFSNRYTGKNLKYLGFASGKISTYLQYGLPVLVNDLGEFSFWLTKNNVGIMIKNMQDIRVEIQKFDFKDVRERCVSAFDTFLSFENYETMILNLIEKKYPKSGRAAV